MVVQTKVIDAMRAGRVVVLEVLPKYSARLGIIINSSAVKDPGTQQIYKRFKVLILTRATDGVGEYTEIFTNISRSLEAPTTENLNRLFHLMMYFSHERLIDFEPEICEFGYPSFTVIHDVTPGNILDLIDGEYISVDAASIDRSIQERKLARGR